MSKITITFEDTFGGMAKIESTPPAGELVKTIGDGHPPTLATVMALSALRHLKDVAKTNKLTVPDPRKKR